MRDRAALPAPTRRAPASVVRRSGVVPGERREGGTELDRPTRQRFERAFGSDFSAVRVHADERAASAASAAGARAYTLGEDVVFGTGEYAPHTAPGRTLIAHELAHVTQQRAGAAGTASPAAATTAPDETAEGAARRSASDVAAGRPLDPPRAVRGPVVQRVSFFEKLGRLIGFEGTFADDELQAYLRDFVDKGRIEDSFDSDNKAREVVRRWSRGQSGYALSAQRKGWLVREMTSGYLSEADQSAIVTVLSNSPPAERAGIDATARLSDQVGRFDRPARQTVSQLLGPAGAAAGRAQAAPQPQAAPKAAGPREFADPRPAVLAADRPMYQQLLGFIRDSRTKIVELLAKGGTEPWMRPDNPVMVELLAALDALIGELAAERLIVRFTPGLPAPVAAQWDVIEDVMSVRPIASKDDAAAVAINALHEYQHAIRDRSTEVALATGSGRVEESAADSLADEREARRLESYYEVLLSELKMSPASQLLGTTLTAKATFVPGFETMRTGTAKQKAAAQKKLDKRILDAGYAESIAKTAPRSQFVIDLDDKGAATLRRGPDPAGAPVPLGTPGAAVTTRDQLVTYLTARVTTLPGYASFFVGPTGGKQPIALFTVVRGQQRIAQFGLPAPSP
ncbi:MAG TPA: DUF4157 domain-containing protein [Thermoleophilaceae bacterium]